MRSAALKKTIELKEIRGLVLRTLTYGEHDKILHIFTPDQGIIHLIAKGALRPKKKGFCSIEPLTLGSFFYRNRPHSKLHPCLEAVSERSHLFLRRDIAKLDCACRMALAVSQTQMADQPAPLLFDLLCYYLKKLESADNTRSILASFQLKLLRHDGLLALPICCSVCDSPLSNFLFYNDRAYCPEDAPTTACHFKEEESRLLALLTLSTDFKTIEAAPCSQEFVEKVNLFFEGYACEGKSIPKAIILRH